MISLLKYLDGPWENVRGYLRNDLEHLEAAINQRWGKTFGDSNLLLPGTIAGTSTVASRYVANTGPGFTMKWDLVNLSNGVQARLPFANLTQGSALSVLGVTGNAIADVASIAAGSDYQVLRRSGTALAFGAVDLSQSAAITGDLPFTNLAQIAGLSVLGVAGNSTADVAGITAASDFQVLRRSGTAIGFGAIDLSQAGAVTGDLALSNLAQGTALSVLGVTGNATADEASIVAGSDYQVLRRAGTAVAFGAIDLSQSAAVTGDLPYANLVPATAISVLVGRGAAAGAGDFQEISLGANLTMTGTVLSGAAGGVGTHSILDGGTVHTDSAARTVATGDMILGNGQVTPKWDVLTIGVDNRILRCNGITASWSQVNVSTDVSGDLAFSNLVQIAGLSVLGVTGNSTADVAAITAASDYQVLRRAGTAVAFGAIDLSQSGAVTGDLALANLAQGTALSVLGVTGNATADEASIVAGADYQVLRRTGTAVAFGAVSLDQSAAVTGILGSANGGTGNGFTKFTGPTTSEKSFALPDASSTLLYSGGALGTPSSGTLTSATGLPLAGLVSATAISILIGRGSAAGAGSWQEITLGANLTMTGTVLSAASGGANHNLLDGSVHPDTVAQSVSRGSLVYGNSTPKWDELVIGSANRLLRSDGTDAAWAQAVLTTDVSGVLPTANGGTGIAYFTAAGPSVARVYTFPDAACSILTSNAAVTVGQGGTGVANFTTNGVLYGNGTTSILVTAQGAADTVLTANGGAPSFSTNVQVGGGIRAKGSSSGTGPAVELQYNVSLDYASINAYDRTTDVYKSMHFDGSSVFLTCSGNSTGGIILSAITGTGVKFPAYGAGAATFSAAGVISSVSDERHKTSIVPFTSGLKQILAIQPISYQYTEASGMGDTANLYAGFSAQDVMQYIPQAIGKGSDGFYTFSDRPVVAALVNAIKELQTEVDELRALRHLPVYDRAMTKNVGETGIIRSPKRLIKNPVTGVERLV